MYPDTKITNIAMLPSIIPDDCAFIGCISFEPRCLAISSQVSHAIQKAVFFRNKDLNIKPVIENEATIKQLFQHHEIVLASYTRPTELADAMAKAIEKIASDYQNLIVDITTFTHESLVMLLKILHLFHSNFKSIQCIYVGADQYSPGSSANETWLSKGCRDVHNIIGFPGFLRPIAKTSLIILAGFEMERATRLIELIEPDRLVLGNGIEPIHCNHSEKMVYFRKKFDIWQAEYKHIECSSFDFSCKDVSKTIHQIQEVISHKPDDNYLLVPLNTKLSTIAATIVGLENRNVQICYAVPEVYNIANYATAGDTVSIVELKNFQVFMQ